MYTQEQLDATIRYLQAENNELKNKVDQLQRLVNDLLIEFKKLDLRTRNRMLGEITEETIKYIMETKTKR
jgi:cell division protein FtsB